MKHYHLYIRGKVQGVYFRHRAKEKADEWGIKGYVKNESDGSIFIEAEGHTDEAQKFLDWCRHGPPEAQVEDVRVEEKSVKNLEHFKIK